MTLSEIVVLLITSAPAVFAACIAGTVTLVVVRLTHYYTRKRELEMLNEKRLREKEDAEEKRLKEFRFISVELIFRLEEFAEKCAQVSVDTGCKPNDESDELSAYVADPVLVLKDVEGEWKSVPARLVYKICELPVRTRAINACADEFSKDFRGDLLRKTVFDKRRISYARVGLIALMLARQLRKLCGYPESPFADGEWPALAVLRRVIRLEYDNKLREESDTEI